MNSKEKSKVIIVCGPTGSGKSDLALKVAKNFNGELINADSRQIYKYLDIGTNKDAETQKLKFKNQNLESKVEDLVAILKSEDPYFLDKIPIHLISFLNPDQKFDVFSYKKLAESYIGNIISRKKLPILVGGTGLYIDSLLRNYKTETKNIDQNLRNELQNFNVTDLQEKLKKLDLEKYKLLNESDINNPRRLIRSIEKVIQGGEYTEQEPEYEFILIYPEFNWNELVTKINNRVEKMFNDGLVQEVKNVLELGFKEGSVALQGIGYKEVIELLNNKLTLDECIERVRISHRQYAKRQRTWFEGKDRNYNLNYVNDPSIVYTVKKLL